MAIHLAVQSLRNRECETAVASVIKVVLMMQHGKIPPQLHFGQLNPHISLQGTRLVIPEAPVDWPIDPAPRVAGVSSFGFGETTAQIILEQAAPARAAQDEVDRPVHLLALSAKTETALQKKARELVEWLAEHPEASVGDVCFSANTGRAHFNHRLAIVAENHKQLSQRLD